MVKSSSNFNFTSFAENISTLPNVFTSSHKPNQSGDRLSSCAAEFSFSATFADCKTHSILNTALIESSVRVRILRPSTKHRPILSEGH